MKRFLPGSLLLLTSLCPSLHAQTVVFIGDEMTLNWPLPNGWINKGVAVTEFDEQPGTIYETAARFQSDVVSLHPNIVHIMVAVSDADPPITDDADWVLRGPAFLSSLDSMVQEAKAANIQVVLGLEPYGDGWLGSPINMFEAIVATYGAQNSIPVINYADALCSCVNSVVSVIGNYYETLTYPAGGSYNVTPTPNGYAVMSQMAERTISTMNLQLQGGYLQNTELRNSDLYALVPNVNVVAPFSTVQFTPMGSYSGGLTQAITNTNFAGSSGTWASSNPLVMSINDQGTASALSVGTTNITYVSPNGVAFSEWTMNVGQP
jgi:hypothetical protein